jgi:hypothetical protein
MLSFIIVIDITEMRVFKSFLDGKLYYNLLCFLPNFRCVFWDSLLKILAYENKPHSLDIILISDSYFKGHKTHHMCLNNLRVYECPHSSLLPFSHHTACSRDIDLTIIDYDYFYTNRSLSIHGI